jgi:hypothetical protein
MTLIYLNPARKLLFPKTKQLETQYLLKFQIQHTSKDPQIIL